jgi:hypothetical protein
MPYAFTEWEQEPEAQASSGHSAIPPRKFSGVGVLDPPVPPKKPVGPIPRVPASMLLRIVAGFVLLAMVSSILTLLFLHR